MDVKLSADGGPIGVSPTGFDSREKVSGSDGSHTFGMGVSITLDLTEHDISNRQKEIVLNFAEAKALAAVLLNYAE